MVASINEDGTYNLGTGYESIHPDFVPDYVKSQVGQSQPSAMGPPMMRRDPEPITGYKPGTSVDMDSSGNLVPMLPDERLAMNSPVVENPSPGLQQLARDTQEAQARPDATPALNTNQAIRQQLGMQPVAQPGEGKRVNPADLVPAGGPSPSTAQGPQGPTPMEQYLTGGMRGSAGTPAGIRRDPKNPETYERESTGPLPFELVYGPMRARKPGESAKDYEKAKDDYLEARNRYGRDILVAQNAVKNAQSNLHEAEIGSIEQSAEGQHLLESNEYETAGKLAELQGNFNNTDMNRRNAYNDLANRYDRTLTEIHDLANKPIEEPGLLSRIGMAVGQGLLTMGSLMAGGGTPPQHDPVREAIDAEVRKRQMELHNLQQLGAGQMSELGRLQSQFGSPEAAMEAQKSILLLQAAHEAEAIANGNKGTALEGMAREQAAKYRADAANGAKSATDWQHKQQLTYQQATGGGPSGLQGAMARLKALKLNPEAEKQEEAKLLNQYGHGQKGEFNSPISAEAPKSMEGTASVRAGVANAAGQVRFPAWTGVEGTGYFHGKPEVAHQAVNTIAAEEAFLKTMDKVKEEAAQFGSTWDPTQRQKIETNMSLAAAKLTIALKETHSEGAAKEMNDRLAKDIILGRVSPGNVDEIIQNIKEGSIEVSRGLVPVTQATKAPGPYNPETNDYLAPSDTTLSKPKGNL